MAIEKLKEVASDMGDNEFKRQIARAVTALETARKALDSDAQYYAQNHDRRNKTKMAAAFKRAVKGVQDALKCLEEVQDEQVD